MNKRKKILMIIVGVLAVFLFVFVIILMIHVKNTNAIVLSDNLSCLYREEVYVSHFIKDVDGTLIDDYLVDTSVIGSKRIDVQYKNRYGFVEQKRFQIEVKDESAPMIVVKNPYIVFLGEVTNLLDDIFCADDYDDGISCVISGEYDLNVVGEYPLSISAQDKSGNETKKEFILNVINKEDDSKSSEDVTYTDFKDVYDRYKDEGTEIGVDISKWQGDVDFEKLALAGVSFVMLKIGGQVEIGGDFILDPKFISNIEKATSQGIKVGVYFYSYAKSEDEARKQARWIVKKLGKYHLSLPIAFDWENWHHYSTFGIGFRTLNHVAGAFISEVQRFGYEGILYSSKYYLENVWYQEDYTKWLAYYTQHNDYDKGFLMWQLCNDGKIDGIDGMVDIDILKTK